MKRFLPLFIFLSTFLCYLEWGGGNSGFLVQLEYDLFFKTSQPNSFLHPLILLPLAGQILLLLSVLLPNRKLTLSGIVLLSLLVLMILVVGLLSMNLKIILSTLPFLALSIFYILKYRKERKVRLDM